MVDQSLSADDPSGAVCPWCSAPRPDPTAENCASCGAHLVGAAEEALPGLTAVDPVAIVRSKQAVRQRSRLLSWLSGDDGDDVFTPAEGQALAPPDLDVRREMIRLELEAAVAALQAENDALLAEAVAEGRVVELPVDETDVDAEGEAAGAEADAAADMAAAAGAATSAEADAAADDGKTQAGA